MKEGGGRIRRLSQEVINRIAAGEVVVRPSAALKELLENSIDAGSTQVSVSVRGGGTKLLQVQDNGKGVHREDFPLLCERFATSKIRSFDDLKRVQTFGFRGEALASVAQVARLTVVSMVPEAACAYRAVYKEGRLTEEPTACAGVQGTIISVEDLFYNLPTRLKTLRPSSEEYRAVLDVVIRYSIRYSGIAMSCKKLQDSSSIAGPDVVTDVAASVRDNIRTAFGGFLEQELLELKVSLPDVKIEAAGYASNANYNMRRGVFILFINGRLVDCGPLKKAIDTAYSAYLPKGTHPFMYLDVRMDPSNVDVNIHPTKKEVRFLHEGALIDATVAALTDALKTSGSSRTYFAQSLIGADGAITLSAPSARTKSPSQSDPKNDYATKGKPSTEDSEESRENNFVQLLKPGATPRRRKAQQSKNVVRVDSRAPLGSMDAYLSRTKAPSTAVGLRRRRKRRASAPPMLTSIRTLLAELEENRHLGLADIFKEHVFVGVASRKYAVIQHKTKLLLADIPTIISELMYRQILMRFADLDSITVDPRAVISELLEAALDDDGSDVDQETKLKQHTEFLLSHANLLEEYFSIKLVGSDPGTAYLEQLPVLFPGVVPDLTFLPTFLLRLARTIDWSNERSCLQGISREIARWYGTNWKPSLMQESENPDGGNEASDNQGPPENDRRQKSETEEREWVLHHVLFASLRFDFDPPQYFASEAAIREITSTARLYRIFERC